MHKKISVVIPAYNAERFIAQAVESALSQSVPPLEVVVVDDGSRDGTGSVVGNYDGRVSYIRQANAGPAAARNRGIREAKGEWIAFLDSDDFWDRNHLELLVNEAGTRKDIALVYSGKKYVDIDGKHIPNAHKQTQFPSGWIFSEMFDANYISSTSVVLAKRETLSRLGGFNEGMRNSEDYDLWLRIAAEAPMCGVPAYTVNYRRHESNLTLNSMAQIRGHLAALDHALALISAQRIDSRNNPERMNTRKSMQKYYSEFAISMFHLREYKELRLLGLKALRKGYLSEALVLRCLLSLAPPAILERLRKLRT